jgi:hypothetical protein
MLMEKIGVQTSFKNNNFDINAKLRFAKATSVFLFVNYLCLSYITTISEHIWRPVVF